jgi:hypothetical protein
VEVAFSPLQGRPRRIARPQTEYKLPRRVNPVSVCRGYDLGMRRGSIADTVPVKPLKLSRSDSITTQAILFSWFRNSPFCSTSGQNSRFFP